jgi:hypothetical protein
MATCAKCVHVEVCKDYIKTVLDDFDVSQMCGDDCEFFQDRSRFVELPDDFPKGRLTMDNPLGNYDALMNYAYAKGGQVLLRYANDKKNVDLCDYVSFHAKDCDISPQDVLDGACLECDDFSCSLGRAYIASVQAAELRGRLKMYEDLAEQALKEREENAN